MRQKTRVSHLVACIPPFPVILLISLLKVRWCALLERLSGGRNLAQLREGPHMVVAAAVTEILVRLRL